MDVAYLRDVGGSSLTDHTLEVECGVDMEEQLRTVPSTYVPLRNANLLAIAVSWAEAIDASAIFIGAHQVGAPYPDCQSAFFEAFNALVQVGTKPQTHLEVVAPLLALDKAGLSPAEWNWEHPSTSPGHATSPRLNRVAPVTSATRDKPASRMPVSGPLLES